MFFCELTTVRCAEADQRIFSCEQTSTIRKGTFSCRPTDGGSHVNKPPTPAPASVLPQLRAPAPPHCASTPLRPPSLASKAGPITVHTCYRHIRTRYLSRRRSHPQDVEGQSHAAVSASRQDLSSSPKISFPRPKRGYAGTTWNEGRYSSNPAPTVRQSDIVVVGDDPYDGTRHTTRAAHKYTGIQIDDT